MVINPIIGVAVRFNHEGAMIEVRMPKPNRHHHCLHYGSKVLGLPAGSNSGHGNQGFYDHSGYYWTREQAMALVLDAGVELKPSPSGYINHTANLFSEDLW